MGVKKLFILFTLLNCLSVNYSVNEWSIEKLRTLEEDLCSSLRFHDLSAESVFLLRTVQNHIMHIGFTKQIQ